MNAIYFRSRASSCHLEKYNITMRCRLRQVASDIPVRAWQVANSSCLVLGSRIFHREADGRTRFKLLISRRGVAWGIGQSAITPNPRVLVASRRFVRRCAPLICTKPESWLGFYIIASLCLIDLIPYIRGRRFFRISRICWSPVRVCCTGFGVCSSYLVDLRWYIRLHRRSGFTE